MALSQQKWIQTNMGMAFAGDICDFFKAKVAQEDSDDAESTEDAEENKSTPIDTYGVWASLVTGESRLVYQGSENQVDVLIEKLRNENKAVDLGYLVPSHIE